MFSMATCNRYKKIQVLQRRKRREIFCIHEKQLNQTYIEARIFQLMMFSLQTVKNEWVFVKNIQKYLKRSSKTIENSEEISTNYQFRYFVHTDIL